ncbi:endonuclease/exonuclease/phosphatase family protein [Actinomadura adrarensis]|uniref:Endonuclease/exonuclease/phosphatase family protein n=1 Tax=Actinomadura adrarensis TaxID=1819600 RepID=A0ABW3CQ78_9ACTN
MLSVLTLNLGAAARPRAEALLEWLAGRPEQVLLLTETSAGPGTSYMLGRFREAGYTVIKTPDQGERGAAIASRVEIVDSTALRLDGVTVPGRVAACLLECQPRVFVVALYVPSRDRSAAKTTRKEQFIASFLRALSALPGETAAHTLVGGDYNVIPRDHEPRHKGFMPFEYALLETLKTSGYTDTYTHLHPGEQAHSWIGRTGDGYRYDYFHAGTALANRIITCQYIHEPRIEKLTDHAAMTVTLDAVPRMLTTTDPASSGALF